MAPYNFNLFTKAGAQAADITIVSGTEINVDNIAPQDEEAYIWFDHGSPVLGDGYELTILWRAIVSDQNEVIVMPLASNANTGDARGLRATGDNANFFREARDSFGNNERFELWNITGVNTFERDLSPDLSWIPGGLYKTVMGRSGNTLTALTYDEENGHGGGVGALFDTRTRAMSVVNDLQIVYATSTHDVGTPTSDREWEVEDMSNNLVAVTSSYYQQLLRNNRSGRN